MSFQAGLERAAEPLRDAVRAAVENGTDLRITGARGWLDAGRPVSAGDELPVRSAGIVEYVPGDLTITVNAGASLGEIDHATAEHGQWLPLDPFGRAQGTVGATLATASAGPLAHAFGGLRDQAIGLGFVTGRGDYVRSGGRVVKNVAGFDLTRLLIGSWGTLGVITDASFRLRARPRVDRTLALVLSDESVRFRQTLDAISAAQIAPLAMELINARLARALDLDGDALLLFRLGGNSTSVAAQRQALAPLGEIRELDPEIWAKLRTIEPPGAAVMRSSTRLADVGALWRLLERQLAAAGALLHSTISRGVVRCIVPEEQAGVFGELPPPAADEGRIFERLPQDMWPKVAPPAVNDTLSRRVRKAFDPAMLLNPGILGEALS